MDDNLGGALLIGDVDGPRAILVVEPRVGPNQLAALLALVAPVLPPSPAALGAQYNRGCEYERRKDSGGVRCFSEPCADDVGPFVDKGRQCILGGRVSEGGLDDGHNDLGGASPARANSTRAQEGPWGQQLGREGSEGCFFDAQWVGFRKRAMGPGVWCCVVMSWFEVDSWVVACECPRLKCISACRCSTSPLCPWGREACTACGATPAPHQRYYITHHHLNPSLYEKGASGKRQWYFLVYPSVESDTRRQHLNTTNNVNPAQTREAFARSSKPGLMSWWELSDSPDANER